MKRKLNKRAMMLLVSLVVLVVASVGATLAYLIAATDPVENTFTPARVSCDVVELFENNVKKDVRIQNTGNTYAYIRSAIVVTWKNDEGEVYAATPVKDTDYSIAFDLENGWVEGNDGFYYYTKEVAPCTHTGEQEHTGCLTGVLITSCSPVDSQAPMEYYLSVEIVASAIQSAPDSVVGKEWSNAKVSVTAKDGTLTVETKQGG